MKCPKCNTTNKKKICSKCGINIIEHIKIENLSINYYNEALRHLSKNYISKAISCLETAIIYNKENITALNLLGLCYDNIGQIADASKYWIMSCLVEEENIASNYLKQVEDNPTLRNKINESIIMYNKAVKYLQQNSDDMALIQLKRAVDYNPNFLEAHNLLSLCYMMQRNNDKAIFYAKKALTIDASNEKATRYLFDLGVTKGKVSKNVKAVQTHEKPVTKVYDNAYQMGSSRSNKTGAGMLSFMFLLGAICVFLFTYFLIMPSIENTNNQTIASLKKDVQSTVSDYKSQLKAKDDTITQLTTKYDALQVKSDADFALLQTERIKNELNDATNYLVSKDYVNAANAIYNIDTKFLPVEDIDKYNNIKKSSYDIAGYTLYNNGIHSYETKKFQNSIDFFNKSISYAGQTSANYSNILYYLGRDYEGLGNNDEAKKYYQQVVDNYPKSNVLYSAKSRLNVISQ